MKSKSLLSLFSVICFSFVVARASAADLIWTGAITGAWDTATLNWKDSTTQLPAAFTNGDTVTFDDTGLVTTVTAAAGIAPGTVTLNGTLKNYVINGAIGGTANPALVKNSSTILTLSGANTWTGALTINAGTLSFAAGGLGASTVTSNLNLAGGTTLQYTGAGTTVTSRPFALGSTNVTIDVVIATGFLQIGDAAAGMPVAPITGSAPAGTTQLTKIGLGTFGNLNSQQVANSTTKYAGDTVLLNGKLQSATASTVENALFGTGALVLGDTSGSNSVTFTGGSGGTGKPIVNPISIPAGNTGTVKINTTNGSTNQMFSGAVIINHDLSLEGGPTNTAGLSFTNSFTGTGNIIMKHTGNATAGIQNFEFKGLNLTGTMTVLPPLSANRIGAIRLLSAGTVSGIVTLNTGQMIALNGFNSSIGSLAGAGTVTDNNFAASTTVALGTLTVGSDNTSQTFTGTIVNVTGVGTGTVAIVKTGTGVQTFGGANTYTGATTVNAGELTIAAGGSITSAATVNGGAALNVNGTSAGVTLNGSASGVSALNGSRVRGTGTTGAVTTLDPGNLNAVIWPGAATTTPGLSAGETLTCSSANFSNGGKLAVILKHNGGVPINQKLVTTGGANSVTIDASSVLSIATTDTNSTTDTFTILDTGATPGITVPFDPTKILDGALTAGTDYNVVYVDTLTPATYTNPAFGALPTPANQIQIVFKGTAVTPVRLADFSAKPSGAGVLVEWTAVSEYQNAGFNIYRRVLGVTEWTQANPALIPGRLTHADAKQYAFYDWPPIGEHEYRLESIETNGKAESYAHFASASIEINSLTEVDSISVETSNAGSALAANQNSARAEIAIFQASNSANFDARLIRDVAGSLAKGPSEVREIPHNSLSAPTLQPTSSPPSVHRTAAVRWLTASRPTTSATSSAVKITYDKGGILRIPQSVLPAGFDINHISLEREGRPQQALALLPDAMLVYSSGYRDDYTNRDALFLRRIAGTTRHGEASAASGLFTNIQFATVTTPATVTNEYHDVYFDFNQRPYNFPPWFSAKYLTSGSTQTFTLDTPAVGNSAAKFTLNLWSLTSSDAINPDHALQVLINGTFVGQVEWDGGGRMLQFTFDIAAGILHSGSNQVDLLTPPVENTNGEIAFVHSMSVDYTRLLDGRQPFTISNAEAGLYELYNVPTSTAWVVDTRFTDRASLVPTESQLQGDGTYRVRFSATAGAQYLVVPASQENVPLSATVRQIKPLRLAGTYLATGPAQFSAGVQRLLMTHAREGIRGVFVDQEQLFDYYNFGRFGPAGIQNAVRATRPQYLLLVGRTTCDYLNYEGQNVDPLCPAFLVSTTFWAQTTSDSKFGDLGRGIPEVAVGRLPVNNAAELSAAVSHIASYKGLPDTGVRIHAVADRTDPEVGDFGAQLNAIAQSNPELLWQTNTLGVTYHSSPEVSAAMADAANGAADVLLYAGHGNASRLGKDAPRILDVDSVQNWRGNVIFLQATCTANWMAQNQTGFKSIAMQALTQPQGGISASIASSTYMNSDVAIQFMNQLLKNVSDGKSRRWGHALMRAQQWAFKQGTDFYQDLGTTEQLFSDPAMLISTPPARSNSSAPATGSGNF